MGMSMCAKWKATFQVEHPQMQLQLQLTLQSGQVRQLPSDRGLSWQHRGDGYRLSFPDVAQLSLNLHKCMETSHLSTWKSSVRFFSSTFQLNIKTLNDMINKEEKMCYLVHIKRFWQSSNPSTNIRNNSRWGILKVKFYMNSL